MMTRVYHEMYASISRGRLNLRPIRELHKHLSENGYSKHYVTENCERVPIAFSLVPSSTGAKLQLDKTARKDRGEIELPYEALCSDGQALYDLLIGCANVYALTVRTYGDGIIHIEWPTKESARRTKPRPRQPE